MCILDNIHESGDISVGERKESSKRRRERKKWKQEGGEWEGKNKRLRNRGKGIRWDKGRGKEKTRNEQGRRGTSVRGYSPGVSKLQLVDHIHIQSIAFFFFFFFFCKLSFIGIQASHIVNGCFHAAMAEWSNYDGNSMAHSLKCLLSNSYGKVCSLIQLFSNFSIHQNYLEAC